MLLLAVSAARAHCWLLPSSQGPQCPFCRAASQVVSSPGFIVSKDFSFPGVQPVLGEVHKVPVGPSLQSV